MAIAAQHLHRATGSGRFPEYAVCDRSGLDMRGVLSLTVSFTSFFSRITSAIRSLNIMVFPF
jgi:hypothetical protein